MMLDFYVIVVLALFDCKLKKSKYTTDQVIVPLIKFKSGTVCSAISNNNYLAELYLLTG